MAKQCVNAGLNIDYLKQKQTKLKFQVKKNVFTCKFKKLRVSKKLFWTHLILYFFWATEN